jgi:hypothetical protein
LIEKIEIGGTQVCLLSFDEIEIAYQIRKDKKLFMVFLGFSKQLSSFKNILLLILKLILNFKKYPK